VLVPDRVGRCEVPETYRESGFGPPQTKLVSTIVTRSHMQRFADGLGGARLRCGLESERVRRGYHDEATHLDRYILRSYICIRIWY
jgi:hypothetical protein